MNDTRLKRDCFKVIALMIVALGLNIDAVLAHRKGMYTTQAAAEKRAKELGCIGSHENNGKWMPCRDEADLHRALRKQ